MGGRGDQAAHPPGEGRRGHTLEYAAPELLGDEARSPATDVWATAVLLYELLCGEMPFGTRAELADAEIAARVTAGEYPDPLARRPYLPRRFRALFRDTFVLNSAQRPLSTAGGLKRALADIAVRCEWVRVARQGHVDKWEGHELSAAGVRTGVVYVAWVERRPRLGVAEAKLTRQQANRRAQALPGLRGFRGSEAQARQRIYTWMRNLTSGDDPRR